MTQVNAPKNLQEAFELLSIENPPQPIAGGTDVMVARKDNPARFPALLVLDNLRELSGIHKEDSRIRIGSRTTHAEIEKSEILQAYAPVLSSAASEIGSVQIRNRGTIGGNIINASPAGDLIAPLIALNATVELQSTKEKRQVSLRDFFRAPGKTVRLPQELLIAVHFALPDARERGAFMKIGPRKAVACSKVMIAVQALVDRGTLDWIRIAIGAVAPTVIRARQTEFLLSGKALTPELISEAGETIRAEISPITDIRSTADYRRHVTGVLLERALESIYTI